MKNLVSVAVVFMLVLGFTPSMAASLEDEAVVAATSVLEGEGVGLDQETFRTGWTADHQGTGILWVLGGGLLAVSVVARRMSV